MTLALHLHARILQMFLGCTVRLDIVHLKCQFFERDLALTQAAETPVCDLK